MSALYARVAVLEAALATITRHMDKIDNLTEDMAEVRTSLHNLEKSRHNSAQLFITVAGWGLAVLLGIGPALVNALGQ